ncbi:PQQ-dependent catabolism-associated CXXCW motif protein [Paracoccus luteus]|uniref:PQQ-dependent catabolism-associated CXXCW motif protein n=1 Tax=Paracoccus luteus TaxID=2508543 RepID=UPI00106F3FE6|nr:PQQ-dependent catabolism-associated CXXCW motif protein [Paracoccus luteus]
MTARAAAVLAVAALLCAPAAAQTVPEPPGYHGEPYRAPVPATLAGATVLDAGGTAEWQAQGAVLIDVLPQVRRPDGLPAGTVWRQPVHLSIPGAVWLPDTGYDRLSPQAQAGFAAALEWLTAGDKGAALVFFCKADCWMSWNAARRAVEMGYASVAWFPGGVEDWQAAGGELTEIAPEIR